MLNAREDAREAAVIAQAGRSKALSASMSSSSSAFAIASATFGLRRMYIFLAHKISNLCCKYLKKEPFREFERETGKHPILGVRGVESLQRSSQYKTCFTKDGKFTPLWDLTDSMLDKIYQKFYIEIPNIYNYIGRTGRMGCPYGSWKGDTKIELDLLPANKRWFIINYFKESYDVLGIDYKHQQLNLILEEER